MSSDHSPIIIDLTPDDEESEDGNRLYGDGGEGDSGERDDGKRGSECDNNAHDGEQLLCHENTTDIGFTLLQWVCILFVRHQLRFGLTNAAVTAILAFVYLLLVLSLTHYIPFSQKICQELDILHH